MKRTIGIVGQGFVGSAIREGMKSYFQVETLDIDPEKNTTCKNITEIVDKVDEHSFHVFAVKRNPGNVIP